MIKLKDGSEVSEDVFYTWSALKQRRALLGTSDDHRANLGAVNKGRKRSEEQKERMRIAQANRQPPTPEALANIRAANAKKRPPRSAESKAKMAASMKAKWASKPRTPISEEQKEKIRATMKATLAAKRAAKESKSS